MLRKVWIPERLYRWIHGPPLLEVPTMSFEKAFAKTMKHEGGYAIVDGHETYMGIDRTKHPQWSGWQEIEDCIEQGAAFTHNPDLTDMVREFYRAEFWKPLRCAEIDLANQEAAEELFEASVNCGKVNGVKFLQRALNALNAKGRLFNDLQVDGVIRCSLVTG
ncbi:MAG: glycosyl hydrolase 108 family protein [Desulfobulbus sp.]|nr:glycosyl hydrolase 108 family protein [Desulfobulbus sp.]